MILEMNSEYIISALIITLSVFVLTILIENKLVPVLRAHKAAQISIQKVRIGTNKPKQAPLQWAVSDLFWQRLS